MFEFEVIQELDIEDLEIIGKIIIYELKINSKVKDNESI